MKKNILLFHIGMPKTATTSLQHFLYENNEILKKYNWSYPAVHAAENTIWKNGNVYLYNQENPKRWNTVKKELLDYNVILSEEWYWVKISNFIEIVSAAQSFHDNIKVIVYLRRQDRAVESFYNQHIKAKSEHESIMDFMNHRMLICNDYFSILEKITEQIGKENVIVRIFEKKQFEGERKDIFSDFIYSLPGEAIRPDWKEFVIPEQENMSLNGNFFEIKKLCNSTIDNNLEVWNREQTDAIVKLSEKKYTQESGVTTGYFTKKERMELLNTQAENNAKVAEKYLKRSDGKLFYDDFVDYPLFENKATEFEEDLICTLSSMIYRQQKKIDMLPVVTAIYIFKKNKKMALWGIGDIGGRLLSYPLYPDIIIDNDPNKNHTTINQIPVVSSSEFDGWEDYFIIVTPMFAEKIEKVLCSKGLKKEENYLMVNEYFDYLRTY